jgi:hypothetical protein
MNDFGGVSGVNDAALRFLWVLATSAADRRRLSDSQARVQPPASAPPLLTSTELGDHNV